MAETLVQCVSYDHTDLVKMVVERSEIKGDTAAIWLRCPACHRTTVIFTSRELFTALQPTLKVGISGDIYANIQRDG